MIALILVMQFGYVVIYACRYLTVMEKCSGKKIPFRPWLKLLVLGRFLNKFVPQLGNIYRSMKMKQDFDISYTNYIAAFASFAWMDTVLGFVIALIVFSVFNLDTAGGLQRIVLVMVVLTVVLAVAPFGLNLLLKSLNFSSKPLSWLHGKLTEVLSTTLTNLRSMSYMLNITLTGILLFAYMCLLFYICFMSLGIPVNIPAIVIFYALFKLSSHVNITPGNLGIQEIAYGVLSEMLNIGLAQGIAVSAVLRIMGFIVLVTCGMFLGGFGLLRKKGSITQEDLPS